MSAPCLPCRSFQRRRANILLTKLAHCLTNMCLEGRGTVHMCQCTGVRPNIGCSSECDPVIHGSVAARCSGTGERNAPAREIAYEEDSSTLVNIREWAAKGRRHPACCIEKLSSLSGSKDLLTMLRSNVFCSQGHTGKSVQQRNGEI